MSSIDPARYRLAIHRRHTSYYAVAIDLPGCVSRGASEVEAIENARVAIQAYVLVAQVVSAEKPSFHVEISA